MFSVAAFSPNAGLGNAPRVPWRDAATSYSNRGEYTDPAENIPLARETDP